jgi:hypothetical protein
MGQEARGKRDHQRWAEFRLAADCYRKALEIIGAHIELYDPEFVEVHVELIAKLDPPIAGPTS